jgi:hypothetical protein
MSRTHPPIVQAAAQGDLAAVTRLLAQGVPVDACGEWEETEEKFHYDKSWTWKSDTALCAATRGGHTAVVQALLAAGADPSFRVCNRCDVHETPRSIAKAAQAAHPECAQALLGPAFEEQRLEAEAAWAVARAALAPSLFELSAHALLVAVASERLDGLPLDTLYFMERVLEACEPAALTCVPEGLRDRVADAWRGAKEASARQQERGSKECLKLGGLYVHGEGVAADEAAAVLWLERGLRSRPVADVADCWRLHAPPRWGGSGSSTCLNCGAYTQARDTLATLAGSAAAGAAAAAALAAEEARTAALLASPLHQLELRRQAAEARVQKQQNEEVAAKRKAAQALQKAQDERWDAEVRQPEVARCAQFAAARRAGAAGGVCTDSRCERQDYCTYYHGGKADLQPRCRWFAEGKCRNGERCWFNHLPRKPPPVPHP